MSAAGLDTQHQARHDYKINHSTAANHQKKPPYPNLVHYDCIYKRDSILHRLPIQ